MNSRLTKLKKRTHKTIAIILLFLTILVQGLLINPQFSQAATYTFTQTNWAGGASTSTATHPGDRTG
ncbi:hypothetical protein HYV91_03375 [Candidatus Wolfebacteria bacterium]|nr:hypothetical protein [Candidatus Wolfebacteria bacterium]